MTIAPRLTETSAPPHAHSRTTALPVWPLTMVFVGYPEFWLLGPGAPAAPIMAAVMLAYPFVGVVYTALRFSFRGHVRYGLDQTELGAIFVAAALVMREQAAVPPKPRPQPRLRPHPMEGRL